MKIQNSDWLQLAEALVSERQRQKLSREQAASVCGVSASFIRDAEANPQACSFGKMTQLINGLGLSLEITGLGTHGSVLHANEPQADYAVSQDRIVKLRSIE